VALSSHAFAKDLSPEHAGLLSSLAQERVWQPGDYLWRQGKVADLLVLVCSGEIALEISVPRQGPLPVETLTAGDTLGCCWLTPSYRWQFDARAVTRVTAIVLEGAQIREACERDQSLGYQILKRLTLLLAERLQRARLRLVQP
jgi:CRP/FNR family cyclic AMP-dependent transcriptional regulator